MRRILAIALVALAAGVFFKHNATLVAITPAIAKNNGSLHQDSPSVALGDTRFRWLPLWTKPAPDLQAVSLSPDGKTLAWCDHKGRVRRIEGATGKTLWLTPPLGGVNRLLAANRGAILAYSALNPAQSFVRVLHGQWGLAHARTYFVEGAVWQAQATPTGETLLIGTGKQYVYAFPFAPDETAPAPQPHREKNGGAVPQVAAIAAQPTVRRWHLNGIPTFLTMSGSGNHKTIQSGTWLPTALYGWNLNDAPRELSAWEQSEPQGTLLDMQSSQNGATVATLSTNSPRPDKARLSVWDGKTGKLLWRRDLNAANPHLLVAPDGTKVAVSYSQMSEYRTGNTLERQLVLYERNGQVRFDKRGGQLMSPDVVTFSHNGAGLTIRDGNENLYTLGSDGTFLSRLRLPVSAATGQVPRIVQTVATPDGRYLLLQRGDGTISLYRNPQANGE